MAELQGQEKRLLEPLDYRDLDVTKPFRGVHCQRQTSRHVLQRRHLLPCVNELPETTFGGVFETDVSIRTRQTND